MAYDNAVNTYFAKAQTESGGIEYYLFDEHITI